MFKIYPLLILLFFAVASNAQSDTCCDLTDSHVKADTLQNKSDSVNKLQNDKASCCCDDYLSSKCLSKSGKPEDVKTIIYDFKTKEISDNIDKMDLKKGNAIRIKVVNLNPFIYKAVINGTDSSYKAVVDANNLLSAFGTLTNLTQLVAGIANNAITAPVDKNIGNGVNNLRNIDLQYQDLIGKENYVPSNKKVVKGKKVDINILSQSDSKKLSDIFSRQKDEIDSINKKIIRLKNLIDIITYQWQRLLTPERTPFPDCDDFSKLAGGSYIKTIKDDFDNILNKDKSILNGILRDQTQYLQGISSCKDLLAKSNAAPYKAQDTLFRNFYVQALTSLNKVDSTLSYKSIEGITESLEAIKGLKLCYTSPPLFLMGDSKIISLQIKPWKDTLPYITDAPITFEIPWHQKHIWGVSAGIYGSFLHNNQYSTKVTVTTTSGVSDTSYNLQKDNSGSGEFGINAIAYEAWRIKESSWYDGFSFGAGLSIESKPKPRVFLGIAFINGDKNRVAFSAGTVAGFVDELSSIYKSNLSNLQINPVNATHSVMKMSFFISINYSF